MNRSRSRLGPVASCMSLLFFGFSIFAWNIPGRTGYEQLSDQWQFLDHQSLQSDANEADGPAATGSSSSPIFVNETASQTANALSTTVYKVFGYRHSPVRAFFFNLVSVALLGLPYLFINWFPGLVILKHRKCCLKFCDFVIGKHCLRTFSLLRELMLLTLWLLFFQ